MCVIMDDCDSKNAAARSKKFAQSLQICKMTPREELCWPVLAFSAFPAKILQTPQYIERREAETWHFVYLEPEILTREKS